MSSSEDFVDVCGEAEVEEGRAVAARVAGRPVLVCRFEGALYAVDDECTHAASTLDRELDGCALVCPLHGARFDVRDGRVLDAPAFEPLRTHAVRVAGGRVEVLIG